MIDWEKPLQVKDYAKVEYIRQIASVGAWRRAVIITSNNGNEFVTAVSDDGSPYEIENAPPPEVVAGAVNVYESSLGPWIGNHFKTEEAAKRQATFGCLGTVKISVQGKEIKAEVIK